MKNVHEYNKMMHPLLTRSLYGGAVSLYEGVVNTSYALRRQTIFTQIIPVRENDKNEAKHRLLLPKEMAQCCTGQR